MSALSPMEQQKLDELVDKRLRGGGGFDEALDARQRVRALALQADPDSCPSWGPRDKLPAVKERNPVQALALLGVHDLIDRSIDKHIADLGAREEAVFALRGWIEEPQPQTPGNGVVYQTIPRALLADLFKALKYHLPDGWEEE